MATTSSCRSRPASLLEALSAGRSGLRGVTVAQLLPTHSVDYFDPATAGNVRHSSWFLGGPNRAGAAQGWIDVVPMNFSEVPALLRRGDLGCDVVFALASPMDEHGFFSLGLSPAYTMAAIEKARAVVLEVNPNVPVCAGNCHIHVSGVAAVVEDDRPIVEGGAAKIGPVEQAIARHIAEHIPDGATLQIGIGAIPDAVVAQLSTKNDLGIHTEMLGEGILSLLESGVVTNRRKNVHPGKLLATFAFGTQRLYEFMDHNPGVEMHPVDTTNLPWLAGQNDTLRSSNSSLQVDLIGQCGSESIGHVPYSGTGGQSDFVRAANISKDGKSFIALPSTAKGGTISRIVPTLTPGSHVTTSKNDVDHVVTEFGVARLRGRSLRDRAAMLIEIAHPDFRDGLREQAAALGLA
jgi:acyl-CoA hydrolase